MLLQETHSNSQGIHLGHWKPRVKSLYHRVLKSLYKELNLC